MSEDFDDPRWKWTAQGWVWIGDQIEAEIERSLRRAEWQEFHDEPCPEIELNQ